MMIKTFIKLLFVSIIGVAFAHLVFIDIPYLLSASNTAFNLIGSVLVGFVITTPILIILRWMNGEYDE
jgi:hypothetical protein